MKKIVLVPSVLLTVCMLLSGCGDSGAVEQQSQTESSSEIVTQAAEMESPDTDVAEASEVVSEAESSEAVSSVPEGDIVDGAASTKENPVPLGTWASVMVSDGGYPTPAYARIVNVDTDQSQVEALIEESNRNNVTQVEELAEHAEFLDYVVVEYEVFFPADFTTSDRISFSRLTFSRENNQEDWIASDGSNYYWMGAVTHVEDPDKEEGHLVNGDTVTGKIMYPMIKEYTDYTLHYNERTEDLSGEIDTYFAISQ